MLLTSPRYWSPYGVQQTSNHQTLEPLALTRFTAPRVRIRSLVPRFLHPLPSIPVDPWPTTRSYHGTLLWHRRGSDWCGGADVTAVCAHRGCGASVCAGWRVHCEHAVVCRHLRGRAACLRPAPLPCRTLLPLCVLDAMQRSVAAPHTTCGDVGDMWRGPLYPAPARRPVDRCALERRYAPTPRPSLPSMPFPPRSHGHAHTTVLLYSAPAAVFCCWCKQMKPTP